MQVSRRTLLMLSTGSLAGLAGCSSSDNQSNPDPDVSVTAFISGPTGRLRLFEDEDIAAVGPVNEADAGPSVAVELTDTATEQATEKFETVNADEQPNEAEIEYEINGDVETENSLAVSPDLAEAIAAGEWDGEFLLIVDSEDQAETVQSGLESG